MRTVLTRSIAEAAEFIRSGGTVAFPTETVYGLGADVFNVDAVARIFEAKQRPPDNPLIGHISEHGQIDMLAAEISIDASGLIEAFFPGPLTLIVPKTARVPLIATAGLDTIGVRMPSAELAREFLAACGTPVVAPSANLSGRPSPTTWQAVFEDLDGRIDCILQGEATDHGLESTVVDCTIMPPVILRLGSLSIEALRSVVPEIGIHRQDPTLAQRSPGLRYKHYAPNARVVLVDSPSEIGADTGSAYIGLTEPAGEFAETMACGSVEDYAHTVFAFFRKCDKAGIDTIYCQMVSEAGIGAALMDRLRRAASH